MESQTVASATLVPRVMKSPFFRTISMAEAYRQIAKRTGLDFNATIELMAQLPTFVEGESHRKIREFMAKQVAASAGLQAERLQKGLTDIFRAVFRPPNEIELVSQIAKPLWRIIASSIWPIEDFALELAYDVPLLFCPTLPLKERLDLNRRIETFRSRDRREENDLMQLSLAATGARTFVGSIVLSLYETVAKYPDVSSSVLAWPKSIPSTALTYIDRLSVKEAKIGPYKFDSGGRARLIIQDPAYSKEENAQMFFGLGTHSCLGRTVSETGWRLLTAQLANSDVVAVPASIRMSEHSEPFSMPIEANVIIR